MKAPSRISPRALIRSRFVRELPFVAVGCALAAFATDTFMIPNGLAAGGVTGLATILAELASRVGITLPVGVQTIAMNALLLIMVMHTGGVRYVAQTVSGFVMLGFLTDLFAPFVVPVGEGDLMLSALWGGILSGVGYGLVFRAGSNTGGTDTLAQIISRKTSLPVGSTVMAMDIAICAASAPVFGIGNALYAGIAMVLMGLVVDEVVDGGNRQRAAFIVSRAWEAIEHDILHELDRGCTRLSATGSWTGEDRPTLFVVFGRREITYVKAIVAARDPEALLVITDVDEAIGEGFKRLGE